MTTDADADTDAAEGVLAAEAAELGSADEAADAPGATTALEAAPGSPRPLAGLEVAVGGTPWDTETAGSRLRRAAGTTAEEAGAAAEDCNAGFSGARFPLEGTTGDADGMGAGTGRGAGCTGALGTAAGCSADGCWTGGKAEVSAGDAARAGSGRAASGKGATALACDGDLSAGTGKAAAAGCEG